jgi:hypothetical protein
MAADSMSQSRDAGRVEINYHFAEKVCQIGDIPVCAMISGSGTIGARPLMGMLLELSAAIKKRVNPESYSIVDDLLGPVSTLVVKAYESVHGNDGPVTRVIVGGYSSDRSAPEVYRLELPDKKDWIQEIPRSAEIFDVNYVLKWGNDEAIQRLLVGYDAGLLREAARTDNGARDALRFLEANHDGLRAQLSLDGMPLIDAVHFAEYLGIVAAGFDRFTTGWRKIGGILDIAAITPASVDWAQKKTFTPYAYDTV